MGLSSLPTPSEGVLTLLVANTAMSVEILKQILNSILRLFGIQPPAASGDLASEGLAEACYTTERGLTERFRARFKAVRFGRRRASERNGGAVDCRVCLARFEAESVVNRLPCGHLFHKECVERWLDYHHATCPLCRAQLLSDEQPRF